MTLQVRVDWGQWLIKREVVKVELIIGGIAVVVAFLLGSWGGRQGPLRALASQTEQLLLAAGSFSHDDFDDAARPIQLRLNELIDHCVSAGVKPEEVFSAVISRGRISQSRATEVLRWMRINS